jgi:hypothetical protein
MPQSFRGIVNERLIFGFFHSGREITRVSCRDSAGAKSDLTKVCKRIACLAFGFLPELWTSQWEQALHAPPETFGNTPETTDSYFGTERAKQSASGM